MSSLLFDVEHLQKLSYERSKVWANFMEDVVKKETLDDFDINDLEKIYGDQCDENDSSNELASMEEDVDVDDESVDSGYLASVANATKFSIFFNNKAALTDSNKSYEGNELVDIFNQTLPIIHEHNRQLKEYGLDKILNSFDKKEIEEKVGSWLNRHNSLYGGDNTVLFENIKYNDCRNRSQITPSNYKYTKSDSDDSLQSGETARYIRSSRVGNVKNFSSTSTMIKSYRMIKSTREALREKYAFENEDDDEKFKAIRHRRKVFHNQDYCRKRYELGRPHMSRKYDITPVSSSSQRRKVLRKRIFSNSCSTIDSSSDSDYCYENCRSSRRSNLKLCCRHRRSDAKYRKMTATSAKLLKNRPSSIRMHSTRMNRIFYSYSQLTSLSMSSSSSFSNVSGKLRTFKKKTKPCSDNRLCKRESDCYCCNEKILCDKFKHIADTSTEEWYVENCSSPKKYIKTSNNIATPNKSATPACGIAQEDTIGNKLRPRNAKEQCKQDQQKSERKPKSKHKASKTKAKIDETTSNKELEMAIKASKESYKKEQEKKLRKKMIDEKEKEYELLPIKLLNSTLKTLKKGETPTCNKSNKQEVVLIEDSPKILKHEINKTSNITQENLLMESNSPMFQIYPENNENSRKINTEDTFFTAVQNKAICNSTALSTQTQAYDRQIINQMAANHKDKVETSQNETQIDLSKTSKLKRTKIKASSKNKKASSTITEGEKQTFASSNTVTSTTIRSPEISCTLTSTQLMLNNESNYDDNSDCALVTSTTNIEKNDNTQKAGTSLSSNLALMKNDILIYTPENRGTVPANCFSSDGCFIITKQHLGSVIGERLVEKFLKYYVGRKRFNSNSTVYYRPPMTVTQENIDISSSDSDDDLENLGKYGDLYTISK